MKIKTCKKVKKFRSIFTREKEVKEINIKTGDFELSIEEHQYGNKLAEPHVHLSNGHCTYSMTLKNMVNSIMTK